MPKIFPFCRLAPFYAFYALVKCRRAGVPLYVLFRKRGDAWIADGLTQSGLLAELNKLP